MKSKSLWRNARCVDAYQARSCKEMPCLSFGSGEGRREACNGRRSLSCQLHHESDSEKLKSEKPQPAARNLQQLVLLNTCKKYYPILTIGAASLPFPVYPCLNRATSSRWASAQVAFNTENACGFRHSTTPGKTRIRSTVWVRRRRRSDRVSPKPLWLMARRRSHCAPPSQSRPSVSSQLVPYCHEHKVIQGLHRSHGIRRAR